MNTCRACHRTNDLYLCTDCQHALTDMLDQIPWLLEELDNRIQKLDRTNIGTIGRTRRPDQLNIIDFDAVELARTIRKKLQTWVEKVAQQHTGRTPPGLTTVTTPDLARWLKTNVPAIARLHLAGPLYRDINTIVGTNQQGGQLVQAINPIERHLVGPCPTITGRHRNGTPRQCGTTLFADTYDRTTTCPGCKQDIDVEANRLRAAAERDLHTKTSLIEVLANIDEPVTEDKLDQWIKARRLRPAGYLSGGTIIEYRLSEADEPVYSVERARKLRRRDGHLRRRWKTHPDTPPQRFLTR